MSLLARRLMMAQGDQIRYFGSSSALGDTGTITPPANMRQGDLVYVYSTVSSGAFRSLTISSTGGQTWNTTKTRDGSVSGSRSIWVSWCTFNGTWSASPQFSISGTTVAKGYIMHVYRAPKIGAVWAVDQVPAGTSFSLVSTTYTYATIPNTQPKTVSIIAADQGLLWVSTQGANWYKTGADEYQITGANNHTVMFLHNIQGYRYPPGTTSAGSITTDSGGSCIPTKVSFTFT